MRRAIAAFVVAFLLCGAPVAMALGFGAVTNTTRLGQLLDFNVAVKLEGDESLQPQCVSADVTAGDSRIPPANVRTRVLRTGRPGEAVVRVSTTTRVREPVVAVLLSLGCPARVSHKFVSLLDPPLPALSRGEAAKAPAATASAPIAAADPAPAAAAEVDERLADREHLQALEERVERLRQEQQSTQQGLAALQAKLRETQEARHDPALYGLATLVVLLLGVIALLLWRQWRLSSEQDWMREAQALTELGPRTTPGQRAAVPTFDEVTTGSMRVVGDTDQGSIPATQPPLSENVAPATIPSAARMRRDLTSEELIDLEQQADFFVALGQEESAIDLLMGQVRSSGGTSPMPYLKLLGIYRRRGEGDAYERIRERFNRRFNAHAPAWEDDGQDGGALDAYPDILGRLQAAWSTPAQAGDLLEALLFRRDAASGRFDLPAYEELLFLYAVARDRAQHEGGIQDVDLLLPFASTDDTPAIMRAHATPPPEPRQGKSVDVDLDFDAPGPAPAGG